MCPSELNLEDLSQTTRQKKRKSKNCNVLDTQWMFEIMVQLLWLNKSSHVIHTSIAAT